jgi:hypothetical protein
LTAAEPAPTFAAFDLERIRGGHLDMADGSLDEAFSRACLWILERRGGDARFLSVHPVPAERGSGISFEIGELSRIELSHRKGAPTILLGIGSASRERQDALWARAGGSEEAVGSHLTKSFEEAGLSESVAVERMEDGEYWIATQLKWSLEELDSVEGRERLLHMIEGFQLAFSKRSSSR